MGDYTPGGHDAEPAEATPGGKTGRARAAANSHARIFLENHVVTGNFGGLKTFGEAEFPGPLSWAAWRGHPTIWALEAINDYAGWLAPRLTLAQGDDAALARLIEETRAP